MQYLPKNKKAWRLMQSIEMLESERKSGINILREKFQSEPGIKPWTSISLYYHANQEFKTFLLKCLCENLPFDLDNSTI